MKIKLNAIYVKIINIYMIIIFIYAHAELIFVNYV